MFQKTVKIVIALPFLVGVCVMLWWPISGYIALRNNEGVKKVESASSKFDPDVLILTTGMNDYAKRSILDNGVELGIISLSDGELVKFWFCSHHLVKGLGITKFQFSDGSEEYLKGHFGCEVDFTTDVSSSKEKLLNYISKYNNTSP